MNSKQQYKLAYALVRRHENWVLPTYRAYKYVCIERGISTNIAFGAWCSYYSRKRVDLIGKNYRALRDSYHKIRMEITLGHY